MTDRMFRAAALALCAAAAACTTSAPPAQVTRFHLNQPIARGNVFVTPLDRAAPPTLEQQSYVNAVARSEEHTSELQSLMRSTYAVYCLNTKQARHQHS